MLIKQAVAGLALATFIGSASVSVFAADVILSGDVAAITTVTVGVTAPLGSTLGSAGLTDFAVATATEKNNVTAGYTVTVSSANAAAETSGARDVSRLRLTGNLTTTPIAYTMKYGGVAVALDAATGAQVITRTSTVNTPDGLDQVLAISTDAATSANAGTYTDTVTLTVAAL
jgi:hypothetical protein